ncbi:heavy metal translocating P-type ATPase [Sulfurospirillum diekertiae]|uniref:P-type Zn(2+) transporter n=1 Tax=Sulfurospirillum diekertiae TaxID=1854492 RepID=A0A1Y0HK02_9BACT|nr:heavy metal translocating P-type ATPase [Sulfurospirillum diekertiae]ARU48290.1 Cadmium, zinc and cobalt-transporting ATPase [Sulfurospirillum diekertiae]ASC93130.1 Cadmium, zinc and cobalt-transporting ATPase [Sulfurospirillum diekertiae]
MQFHETAPSTQTCDATTGSCCSRCQPIVPDVQAHHHVQHHEGLDDSSLMEMFKSWQFITFCIGAVLFISAVLMDESNPLMFWTYLISFFLVGGEILYMAVTNLFKGHVFDENFLMGLATVGAFSIGQYPEGVAVMLFFRVGEFFQDLAVDRSRKSITKLMDIRPDFANLQSETGEQKVAPSDVALGSHIIVRPGEKIPLDGVIIEGRSTLDTSALTGESLPKEVAVGSEVLSGTINKTGVLVIETTKLFAESTVSKILDLVQNASAKKAKTEQFITTFAKYYTPLVVISAALLAFLPPLLMQDALLSDWFRRSLVFLVVSCPCALVVSIPLSFFGGIGGASKNGILVKGGNFLEALNGVDTVVFDKTGTLTKGIFSVTSITALQGHSEAEVLRLAALAEMHSNHPIALSIKRAYTEPLEAMVSEYEELAGYGVKATIEGKTVLAGNDKLLKEQGIVHETLDTPDTVVHIVIDGVHAGYLTIADEPKEDSKQAILALKALGIKDIVMLTGDNKAAADKVAKELGIAHVEAELLPHQKVEKLEELMVRKNGKGKTVFVGDGINDAPVLARSDIGIAMGGVGSDAAIEAADIVIMTDEISKVATALKIAHKTHAIVWQNIIFALGVKGIILIMGAMGIATMWEAVFGDVGVALIAVLNATRVLTHK